MREAGEAAGSAADPADTSERAAEHAVATHEDEASDWATESSDQARREATRRATGWNRAYLEHSSETQGLLEKVEKKWAQAKQYRDRLARAWRSPLWHQLPTQLLAYLTGLMVAVGTAVGVVKVVEKPNPSPLVIVAGASRRVQEQVYLDELRRGIEKYGRLMATVYDPATLNQEGPVPAPIDEPLPVPESIAELPIAVVPVEQAGLAPTLRALDPDGARAMVPILTPRALIPQLTTPQAQQAAIEYISEAQEQGRQLQVTYQQWSPAPTSSNPPTSLSTRSIFGSHYITLNSWTTTP
jgi:hypothetical protein